jgi:hypothetical protein
MRRLREAWLVLIGRTKTLERGTRERLEEHRAFMDTPEWWEAMGYERIADKMREEADATL